MRSGSTWRGPVLLGVSVLAALAAALPTATVGAAPQTTPVSGPPPPCARVGGCQPVSTMTIDPRSGPVGTVVNLHAVCAHVTAPAAILGSLIAASDGYEGGVGGAVVDITPTREPSPTGTFGFTGTFTIPDTLYSSDRGGEMTPRPIAPGMHSVWAACFGPPPADPFDTLPMQDFCVTPSPLCSGYARYLGAFEDWGFSPGLFISHVATLFTASAPAPPPPTTTTTRPRGGGTPGGGGDSTPPVVDSLGVSPSSIYEQCAGSGYATTATVSWSASDNVAVQSVAVSWSGAGGGGSTVGGASGSVSIGPFPNAGTVSITAVARDAAGNTGSRSATLTVQQFAC